MTARPTRVRLRAYKVGFGDCLLLSVTYGAALPDGRRERHVLIDCGTMEKDDGGPRISDIATKVAEHCDGQLDVVVVTHRHKDHLSGFGDSRARDTLDALNPKVVVRPWTDVPEDERGDGGLGLDAEHQRFLQILDKVPEQAAAINRLAFDNDRVAARAAKLAELGFKNTKAVALLEDWGRRGRPEYVKAGAALDLTDVLPDVGVRVLGPPTLEQVPILNRYAKESHEYWLALAADGDLTRLVRAGTPSSLQRAGRILAPPRGMGAAEWLLRRLDSRRISQGLEIVEAMDDVLNNTSVILLVTVGKRRLLLPGDAQAENWSFTLDSSFGQHGRLLDAELASELAKVDLYKIGHHGSLNATPKRLLKHWTKRDGTLRPIVSVLTTKRGVYDKSDHGAVPKQALVDGLAAFGPVHDTDALPDDVWWMDLEASARGNTGFSFTPGPSVPPLDG